jgi:hypothetical protein
MYDRLKGYTTYTPDVSSSGTTSSRRSATADVSAPAVVRIDECLSIRGGRLYVEGCDAVELARRFGTPVYVVSENHLRRNARRITSAFASRWTGGPVRVLASIKANFTLATRDPHAGGSRMRRLRPGRA